MTTENHGKHSDSTHWIGFEYNSPDLAFGETISSCVVTEASGGLTLGGTPSISSNEVSEKVSGGTVGHVYTVKFKTTTSAGNIFIDFIKVEIIGDPS